MSERRQSTATRTTNAGTASAPRVCVICGSELRPGALICNECGQYQTRVWRVWANVSFSGLVSFVSVVTLAVAFLNTQVFFRRSDIRASAVRCEAGAVVVALSNLGTRPAVLRGGSVVPKIAGIPSTNTRALQPAGDSHSLFLRPDAAEVARLAFVSPADNSPVPLPVSAEHCTYQITLDVIAFDQTEQHLPLMCDCPKS